MCNHEESTQPTPATRRQTADALDGAMQHLYNLDAILNSTRMALEYLQDEMSNKDLCHLVHLLVMGNEELSDVYKVLQELFSQQKNVH